MKTIKSGKKELRSFAKVMTIASVVIFGLAWWLHGVRPVVLIYAAAFFFLAGFIAPVLLWPIHKIWMTLALMMGWVMTRIILTILFYLVVTPIGLLSRILGKRFLDLSFRENKESYWIHREQCEFNPKKYEVQY
ncbi:MAG: hypothetical protein JW893_03615 [Candidatus Omnitrophica bacterium]|nr:hypothetical protein [Candidatus Omnitrophota bacterium]